MPHNVETMFSFRDKPWHGLGKVVREAPDSEQALILAGLNWGVGLYPMPNGITGEPVEGYFQTIRMSDSRVLGVVKKTYKPVQNRESFMWMDGLLGEGAKYETAGSLGEGRHVWMCAKLPEEYKLVGDPTECYLIVRNSHDGTTPLTALIAPIRVVCQNTLNLALNTAVRSWSIRHSGDLTIKMDEAQRALGMAHKYMDELVSMADMLKAMEVASSDWNNIVEKLLPLSEAAKTEGTIERQRERQGALYSRMLVPDLEEHRWTGWGVINAVADYADHATKARQTQSSEETRFKEIMAGHPLVDKALALLV